MWDGKEKNYLNFIFIIILFFCFLFLCADNFKHTIVNKLIELT